MPFQIYYSLVSQKVDRIFWIRKKIFIIAIVIEIFGGLVGGPILSLADYYAPPERRFWTFMIPELIGFGCLILMVIWGKTRKGEKKYQPDGNDNL